eukprot:12926112-Prorocentrum_lima.AAC.1
MCKCAASPPFAGRLGPAGRRARGRIRPSSTAYGCGMRRRSERKPIPSPGSLAARAQMRRVGTAKSKLLELAGPCWNR